MICVCVSVLMTVSESLPILHRHSIVGHNSWLQHLNTVRWRCHHLPLVFFCCFFFNRRLLRLNYVRHFDELKWNWSEQMNKCIEDKYTHKKNTILNYQYFDGNSLLCCIWRCFRIVMLVCNFDGWYFLMYTFFWVFMMCELYSLPISFSITPFQVWAWKRNAKNETIPTTTTTTTFYDLRNETEN